METEKRENAEPTPCDSPQPAAPKVEPIDISGLDWGDSKNKGRKNPHSVASRPPAQDLWAVWFLLPYLVGIFIARYHPLAIPLLEPSFGVLALSLLLLLALRRLTAVAGYGLIILAHAALGVLGYCNGSLAWLEVSGSPPNDSLSSNVVEIITAPAVKSKRGSAQVQVIARYAPSLPETTPHAGTPIASMSTEKSAAGWLATSERAMLYFSTADSLLVHADVGDRFLVLARPIPSRTDRSPGGFDYNGWLHIQGISYSLGTPTGTATKLSPNQKWEYRAWAASIRRGAVERFRLAGLKGDELGLVAALTVGDRKLLSPEIRQTFSKIGIAHVLALSGLHVGFVYGALLLLCRFIPGNTLQQRLLRYGLPLLGVVFFALVAGGSPSLVRAVVMLFFFSLSHILPGRRASFSALAGAALCLLLYDPRALFSVGFQFSFAAVAGILLFASPLMGLVRTHCKFLHYCWGVLCVSLAAQVGTLPLQLYYFGVLPTAGLVINLLVIPLTSVLVPAAVILAMLPGACLAAIALGIVVEWLAKSIDRISALAVQIPGSQIEGIELAAWVAVVFALGIVLLGVAANGGISHSLAGGKRRAQKQPTVRYL